jgi:hypothetical protein
VKEQPRGRPGECGVSKPVHGETDPKEPLALACGRLDEMHERDRREPRDDGPENERPARAFEQEAQGARNALLLAPGPEQGHARGNDPEGDVDRAGRAEARPHGEIAQHQTMIHGPAPTDQPPTLR